MFNQLPFLSTDISKVAIVIVTWNKINDVCSLISDVNKLNINGIHSDIFVVDNASDDGTQDFIEKQYPQIKVLQTGSNLGGSGGFSHGLNFVKELDYDYIWLLDNDVRLDENTLFNLVETLKDRTEVGIVGSQIRKLENPSIIHEMGLFVYAKKAHLKNNFVNVPITSIQNIINKSYLTVDICSAASLLVRAEVVNQIGVFEDYFLHFDDVEWCLRATKADWVVAANPRSIAFHPSPETKQRPWIIYYDERNLCYCWLKHKPELLLKRIGVLVPKLLFYTLTGRYFLVEIYFQAFNDFLLGVKGKMKIPLPFVEYQLEQIIEKYSVILVDPIIYNEPNQNIKFKQLELKYNFTSGQLSKNQLEIFYINSIAAFHKATDLGFFPIDKPAYSQLFVNKKVYYFTGAGYVLVDMEFKKLLNNFFKTCLTTFQIYLKLKNKIEVLEDNK